MIQSITVQNYADEVLAMSLYRPQDSGFIITDITGLGPSKAAINMTDYATIDGSSFNSSRVQYRNIIMKLRLLGSPSIEETRYKAYRYFPVKHQVTITVETDTRCAKTTGYVETCEPVIFSQNEEVEVSIICPDPVWYAVQKTSSRFSGVEALFEFPFENEGSNPIIEISELISQPTKIINYLGDYDVGAQFRFHVYNTVGKITLYHLEENALLDIDPNKLGGNLGTVFIDGDEIVIDTNRGFKSAQLIRGGQRYNILDAIGRTSRWIQIQVGINTILYSIENGNIQNASLEIFYSDSYQGV